MMEELARRAVACDRWRWMPGMLGLSPKAGRWRVEQADLTALCGAGAGPASIHEAGVWLPDLDDPATVGCLLALVREAWGDRCLHVGLLPARWGVWTSQNMPLHESVGKGLTEAEALVAALEAAP